MHGVNKIKPIVVLAAVLGMTVFSTIREVVDSGEISDKNIKLLKKKLGNASQRNRAGDLMLLDARRLSGSNELQIKRIKTLCDFAGNQFVLTEFSTSGYSIYDVNSGTIVEVNVYGSSPYLDSTGELLYVPLNGYYARNGKVITDLIEGEAISEETAEYLAIYSEEYSKASAQSAKEENIDFVNGDSQIEPADYEVHYGEELVYADTEVPYSWYFKLNNDQFPHNGKSFCGYTAASMLLGYNEFFNSTGYFSEEESRKYINPYIGNIPSTWPSSAKTTSPGGVPEIIDAFPTEVWGDDIGGSTPSDIDTAIKNFMDGKDKEFEIYNFVSIFANVYDPIKDGCPAILFGNLDHVQQSGKVMHAVVAYGSYDDGRLLCHYGWEGYQQVVISLPGLFEFGGVIAIFNKSRHIHNEYFKDAKSEILYCGCGEVMSC